MTDQVLDKLYLNLDNDREVYLTNQPIRHIVYQDFFPDEFLDKILEEFPESDSSKWDLFMNEHSVKKEINTEMGKHSQKLMDFLNSESFLVYLRKLTGLDGLIADRKIYGGGLNFTPVGGFLDTHIDFNFNNDLQLYRCLNIIVYLGKNWKEEDGGILMIKTVDSEGKSKKVIPKYNTVLIFEPSDISYHGFNKVVNPSGRKSISTWYYKKDPNQNMTSIPHRTIWVE